MDFGLFCLLNQRDKTKAPATIIAETVEQVRLAEQVGFGTAWFAEHHFSNYCLCPSPLLMAAHVAGVTTRIKLGTGVVVLPLYTPARLLAEIGFVDALSGGRLVLGIGSGYQPYEFERFGADLADSKERTEEILDMIETGLAQPSFSYEGAHYRQLETHIPVRPTRVPPIWVAGASPALQRRAARSGYTPIVTGRMDGIEFLLEQRRLAEEIWRSVGKDPATMPFATLGYAHVTEDKAQAMVFADNARFQNRLASSLRRRAEALGEDGMLREIPYPGEKPLEEIARNLVIGDVTTCIERCIAHIRAVRPVHMALYFALGDIPQSSVLASIERFGTEVIPGIERILGPLEATRAAE
jgi:alkanesulfonate monooxygenase SsuD/methylene tetrahydromethanopterin reductase-like flavin-dependent oxidoreductase (luciferase family)